MQTALVNAISVKNGTALVNEAPFISITDYTSSTAWMNEADVSNASNVAKLVA